MKNKGFTLVEAMVTLAILAIVMSIAVPSFRNLIADNRLSTTTNDFVSTLSIARSEAIKRSQTITVIANAPSPATNEWASGWKVKQGAAELRVFDPVSESVTIDSVGNITQFNINSRGLLVPGTGIQVFNICDNRSDETGRQITVGITGQHSLNRKYTGCNP